MFWDKHDKKYLAKIKRRVIFRKTKYWRKNLHFDRKETNIKIIMIKSDLDWMNNVIALKTWNNTECFLWRNKNTINTLMLKQSCDMVGTNIKGEIIEIKKNIPQNELIFFNKKVKNIWIFQIGCVEYYNIKNKKIIDTK